MVFSSLTFLYLFLPLAVLPYFLVKNRTWRNGLLLVLSLFKVCCDDVGRHCCGLCGGTGH